MILALGGGLARVVCIARWHGYTSPSKLFYHVVKGGEGSLNVTNCFLPGASTMLAIWGRQSSSPRLLLWALSQAVPIRRFRIILNGGLIVGHWLIGRRVISYDLSCCRKMIDFIIVLNLFDESRILARGLFLVSRSVDLHTMMSV